MQVQEPAVPETLDAWLLQSVAFVQRSDDAVGLGERVSVAGRVDVCVCVRVLVPDEVSDAVCDRERVRVIVGGGVAVSVAECDSDRERVTVGGGVTVSVAVCDRERVPVIVGGSVRVLVPDEVSDAVCDSDSVRDAVGDCVLVAVCVVVYVRDAVGVSVARFLCV